MATKNRSFEYHAGQEIGGCKILSITEAARRSEYRYETQCLKCGNIITRTHSSLRQRDQDNAEGCMKCQGSINKKNGEKGGRPSKPKGVDVSMAMSWRPLPRGNLEQ